ncbi:MAG: hypothetical protein Q9218_002651 [Villophora microphyllina]
MSVTNTVYIYQNITIYSNIYHTLTHSALVTVHQPIDRPVTATIMLPSTMSKCPSVTAAAPAKATNLSPVSVTHQDSNRLSSGAIAGIVIGVLAGLALLLGTVWFAIRKWRQWKAKKAQRMQGVELQRAWEREEETGRALDQLAKGA